MNNTINEKDVNIPFFVIDHSKNITSFNLDPSNTIELISLKKPQIGQSIMDIFPPKYTLYFSTILNKCLAGNNILVKERLINQIVKSTFKVQILFLSIYKNVNLSCAVCLILPDISLSDKSFPPVDYSRFTSHELRAPVSNILSLSNFENYPKLQSYGELKIKDLLKNIYTQAEKLNDTIATLNFLINKQDKKDIEKVITEKLLINHIVIVDDDPLINIIHKKIILRYNKDFSVKDFDNPINALDYIYREQPDLIFLDINMPEMDAWEFLDKLEEYPFKVPVIVISSSIDHKEISRAYAHKCVKKFVSKPLTYEKLNTLFIE